MEAALDKYDVPGVTIAISAPAEDGSLHFGHTQPVSIEGKVAGHAVLPHQPMQVSSWVQFASLSKTIGTAFALEQFEARSWDIFSMPVNQALAEVGSEFALLGPWGDKVRLVHLCNHTALGMHYVPGFTEALPPIEELIAGRCDHLGYGTRLVGDKEPGKIFAYSGGGFLVLQHLLTHMCDGDLETTLCAWLETLGAPDIAFGHAIRDELSADGYYSRERAVPCRGGFAFPALAAGARGRVDSLACFLCHLVAAYQGLESKISTHTAQRMIDNAVDLGALDFMHARAGLGVFVATAGPNTLLLHQAANDGFRGLYVICCDGPDLFKGFVLISNGDNPAVLLNAELSVLILKQLQFRGIDFDALSTTDFGFGGIPQEQIVNLGYKQLLFRAFQDRPSS